MKMTRFAAGIALIYLMLCARLHQRTACANAAVGDCLQRLPEGQPLPDAGKRPGN